MLYFEPINLDVNPVLDKIEAWKTEFLTMLPNAVIATLIFIVVLLLAKAIRQIMNKYLSKIVENKTVSGLITYITYISIIVLGILISLSILNLDGTVQTFLAGAGIIGIALGFAFQDTAANVLSGIFMAFKKNYRVGDIVETQDMIATIEEIDLRFTRLKTLEGFETIIPNRKIFQEKFVNYNTYITRRVEIICGVAYDSDLEQVEQVVLGLFEDIREVRQTPSPEFYYTEFSDSSINFTCRFWIDFLKVQDYLIAKHDVIKAIKSRFDEEGITIPFPMRTIVWKDHTSPENSPS